MRMKSFFLLFFLALCTSARSFSIDVLLELKVYKTSFRDRNSLPQTKRELSSVRIYSNGLVIYSTGDLRSSPTHTILGMVEPQEVAHLSSLIEQSMENQAMQRIVPCEIELDEEWIYTVPSRSMVLRKEAASSCRGGTTYLESETGKELADTLKTWFRRGAAAINQR